MAMTLSHSSSYKAFQETISRSMAPLLQKYGGAFRTPNSAEEEDQQRRSMQHAELLKRQQEMFHRLLYLGCLYKEGMVQEEAVEDCKLSLLFETRSMHPDGEWPAFTRDKLLFLQDLLFAKCISEDEFQSSKSVLLQRMAGQGGDVDIILLFDPNPSPVPPSSSDTAEIPPLENSLSMKNSPIKQVRDAMKLRLKATNTNASPSRHPPHLPLPPQRLETGEAITPNKVRDMDIEKEKEKGKEDINEEIATTTPLQSSKSPLQGGGGGSSSAASRVKSIVSGLFQRVQIAGGDGSSKTPEEKRTPWSPAELLRPPRKLHFEEQLLPPSTTTAAITATESKLEPILMEECQESEVLKENNINNTTTNEVVTPKKKIHPRVAPPVELSTDKVLTENIKSKLSQIRTEMAKRDTNQTFTSEQIEAIAKRLPIDKDELQRLFPKTWCDRYGDIVLDVVHKEFQLHLRETNRVREKQRAKKKRSTVVANNENSVIEWQMSSSSPKCLDQKNVPSPRVHSPLSSKENKVWRGNTSLSRDLDGIRNQS